MGDHKRNPVAIAAANRPPLGVQEILGFQFETSIELRKERMDEINAAGRAAELAGEDPRMAVHRVASQWNPKEHPEEFDFVVYNRATVGRPSPLLPDPRQVPTAMVRLGEHLRINMGELRRRADAAFANAGAGGNVQH